MALDTASATPLFQQLAEELRQAIRTGGIPPAASCPPSTSCAIGTKSAG